VQKTRATSPRRSPTLAALWGAPIGLLGGLIGLGGAEFRLPVLVGAFGYAARRAVALNLAISLITVVSALVIRGGTLSLAPLLALLPVVAAMIAGAPPTPTPSKAPAPPTTSRASAATKVSEAATSYKVLPTTTYSMATLAAIG
jgi:hypothetical protein